MKLSRRYFLYRVKLYIILKVIDWIIWIKFQFFLYLLLLFEFWGLKLKKTESAAEAPAPSLSCENNRTLLHLSHTQMDSNTV